jgi:preprotein translocase subunit Sec63
MPSKGGNPLSSIAGTGWLPSRDDFLKFPFLQFFHGVPRTVLEALLVEHVTCMAVLSLRNEKDASVSKKELRQKEIEAVDHATKEVSKLYRKSSAKFHPDRFGDTYGFEHDRLQAAYDVLKDKDQRRYYINSMWYVSCVSSNRRC